MIWIDLNRKFNYTLKGKTYRPLPAFLRLIYLPTITKNDWGNDTYKVYKKSLKESHYFDQNTRCAYCRLKLRVGAYWDELDHIIPQSIKGDWIFYPKNLVVSCKPCNSLKNDFDTRVNNARNLFPLFSRGFKVFNPHFDEWSDHFEIHRGIFLRGKIGTKGPETYNAYRLYRYHIAIGYSEEKRFRSKKTYRRLTHLLRESGLTTDQIKGLQDAVKYIIKLRKHGQ